MEEEIIYYLFEGKDIDVFRKIYTAFQLESLQTEIYIECKNPRWVLINDLDDFLNSYKNESSGTVMYSVKSAGDIHQISFSYMYDGYLLAGFSVEDSSKVDFKEIEGLFGKTKFLAKKITTEEIPFENKDAFFNY